MTQFHETLIPVYVSHQREKALAGLSPRFPASRLAQLSTPVLSYLYFAEDVGWERSTEFIEKLFRCDAERQRSRVGYDILGADSYRRLPDEERLYWDARKLIKDVWNEYDELITSLDPWISKRSDALEESLSEPKQFGEIFFSMKRTSAVGWAEILVHEVGHQYLFALSSTFPGNNIDLEKKCWSSIRKEERPLIGVFHGAFAGACMVELACRIIASNLNEEIMEEGWTLFHQRAPDFLADLATIEKHSLLELDQKLKEQLEHVRDLIGEKRASWL